MCCLFFFFLGGLTRPIDLMDLTDRRMTVHCGIVIMCTQCRAGRVPQRFAGQNKAHSFPHRGPAAACRVSLWVR